MRYQLGTSKIAASAVQRNQAASFHDLWPFHIGQNPQPGPLDNGGGRFLAKICDVLQYVVYFWLLQNRD